MSNYKLGYDAHQNCEFISDENDNDVEIVEVAKLLNAKDARIKELEQALDFTNKELHVAIERINNDLAENIHPLAESEPDYWDFQTIHDNQVLLSGKPQPPEVKP